MGKLIRGTPKEKENRLDNNKDRKIFDHSRLMNINNLIATPKILCVIAVLFYSVVFLLLNYAINIIINFFNSFKLLFSQEIKLSTIFEVKNFITFSNAPKTFYIILALIVLIIDVVLVVRIRISYKDNNVGQKGSERWTTIEELQKQYKAIPDKDKIWEGSGGVIISHYKDKYFIDEEPGHSLIIGTTRSGKGELFVRAMIDSNSRASIKPSMVINDPKLDLAPAAKPTLEKRGYDVYVVNLIDPYYSSGYNPLQVIVDKYKEGKISEAQTLSRSFAYSIYCSDTESNDAEKAFWSNTATDLTSAHIISLIEDCLAADKRYNALKRYEVTQKKEAFQSLTPEEKEKLRQQLAEGSLKEKDTPFLPDEYEFKASRKREKQITMFSIINIFRQLASVTVGDKGKTALDMFFGSRSVMDKARIIYASVDVAGYRTKTSVYSNMLTKLTIFNYDEIQKLTAESSFNISDIGFGDKPIALFIGLPDYDKSNHFLSTILIQQIYYVLSKQCSYEVNQKCKRPVEFIIDEFGVLPVMQNIELMLSLGASRQLFMNLIVQAYSQITDRYKDAAETILNNCQNQIYIKSIDDKSAEKFSKMIGNETITNVNRIGKLFQLGKTFTETQEEQLLINSNQLMNLLEGEVVVKRVMHRKDLKGNSCYPYSIFNTGETLMPSAHNLIADSFPYNLRWIDICGKNTRENIVLSDTVYDIANHYNVFVRNIEETKYHIAYAPDIDKIVDYLLQLKSVIQKNNLAHITIAELMSAIKEPKYIKSDDENKKQEFLEFLYQEQNKITESYREINFA